MKYLFGASGHAKVVLDVIKSTKKHKIEGVFDDYLALQSFSELPFLGKFSEFDKPTKVEMIISIGDNQIRKRVVQALNVDYFTALDKNAIISQTCSISKGTVVMPNVVISSNANIGKHCIINTAAIIEHDCYIENFVHISPNATITGNVTIGEGTHIGAGAVIIPNIKIGKWCVIGAGSVILKDIPDYSTVVGNPARVIKTNKI